MANPPVKKSVSFDAHGLSIEGLRWREGQAKKVLALHGWLDNAASFSLLAPYIENVDFVAIDLAGHGKSGFRPGLSAYNIWQDLIEINEVVNQLGWDCFTILGHSRGAMIASLFAGAFPDKVDGICLIDAITPLTISEGELPKQLAQAITNLPLAEEKRSTHFASYDKAALARTRGLYPLSKEASQLLAERSVIEIEPGVYTWRYDKKLMVASEIRLSDTQVRAFVDAFPCQACVVMAKGGFGQKNEHPWFGQHDKLNIVAIEGQHHLQLAEDKQTISELAKIFNEYLSTN